MMSKRDANTIVVEDGEVRLRDWLDHAPALDFDDLDQPELEAPENEAGIEFDTICVRKFAKLELPPRATILKPILPERGLAMLFAGRGIGKTHVALGIAHAVSTGGEFLRWQADRARTVLYVDGEMPQEALQGRLLATMKGGRSPSADAFRLLCMDRQPLGTSLNLADPKQQEVINSHLEDVEFLVLDNLSTLVNGGPENDAESWISMQAWLLQLRRRGVTVLVVHHAGRGGNARGTSKREDVLDTIIQLKHPEDYDPADGARFEVHLTKARGVFGDDALAFEAKLELDDQGAARWLCSDLKNGDEDMQKVLDLSENGMSIRDIGKELKMSKSKADRLLQRAKRLKKTPPPSEAA